MITRPVKSLREPSSQERASGSQPNQRVVAHHLTDRAIRSALRTRVLKKHLRAPRSVVIEELGLCRGFARVDIAVVNGLIHGYEIKSDRDSLRRLAAQVEAYGRIFDRLTLVVGERYQAEAARKVPRWWGIIRVIGTAAGPAFHMLRRPKDNPRRDPRALVELLWAGDALELLEARGVARGVRGRPRRFLWERIVQEFRLSEIASAVRDQLKARRERQAHQ